MKEQNKNGTDNDSLSGLEKIQNEYIDNRKFSSIEKDFQLGVKNYFLFQKFFYFRWPYWLYHSYSAKSRTFNPITPFLLINNNNRDWISFANQHIPGKFFIDPAGMISPAGECWSIEFWILAKGILYRPQERTSSINQKRDVDTYIVNTRWEETDFELIESIYNIGNDFEELAVELRTVLHKSIPHTCFFIVLRPYNISSLGGINSIEYNNKTKVIQINGKETIYLENRPDYTLAGNSSAGDIDFNRMDVKAMEVKCGSGMATMGFGYNLSRGDNEHKIRLSLPDKKPGTVKLDYSKLKNKYIEDTHLRSKNGLKTIFPDKIFQNWINGSKISALNFFSDLQKDNSVNADFESLFYILSGYNRIGFLAESLEILESVAGKISKKDKLTFRNILDRCYFLAAVSDYFKLSRNIDYLRAKYNYLRELIYPVLQYSQTFKQNKRKYDYNSIENYFIREFHVYDVFLISYTLAEFSYLARCLGIFNDEKKFNKEILRLGELIIKNISKSAEDANDTDSDNGDKDEENTGDAKNPEVEEPIRNKNEFYAYNVFAGFPFNVNSFSDKKLKALIDEISDLFQENPMYFRSLGACDMFFSIIYAINLLLVKDTRVHSIIARIFEFGKEKYALPDFINPKTGCGIKGKGDSIKCISSFIILLRSVLFMDSQEKLEIFPAPKAEWFAEGSEIRIEDAPSIFGIISFKVISIKNEVQIYFSGLPKYLPPNIVINLPFETKIKQEDDFILKKEIGNSYVIHGWPSIIRFFKK